MCNRKNWPGPNTTANDEKDEEEKESQRGDDSDDDSVFLSQSSGLGICGAEWQSLTINQDLNKDLQALAPTPDIAEMKTTTTGPHRQRGRETEICWFIYGV